MLKRIIKGLSVFSSYERREFHGDSYLRHNARRLEHLASLRISVTGKTVFEVGAGIGDHTSYFVDRGCKIISTDVRKKNVYFLQQRFPEIEVYVLDLDNPCAVKGAPFDVVHCYGLLYHLEKPEQALKYMSENTKELLLLETCVSFGDDFSINLVHEDRARPSQSGSGVGCRPTRPWVMQQLKKHFPYVYVPITQPNHEEYPIDWTNPSAHSKLLSRAVFIASRLPIDNSLLKDALMDKQYRHE